MLAALVGPLISPAPGFAAAELKPELSFAMEMLAAAAEDTVRQAAQRLADCPDQNCPEPNRYSGTVKLADELFSFSAERAVIGWQDLKNPATGSFDAVPWIRGNAPAVGRRCPACIYFAAVVVGGCPCPAQGASYTCGSVLGYPSRESQTCAVEPPPRSGDLQWGPFPRGGTAALPTTSNFTNGPFMVGDGWGWIGN